MAESTRTSRILAYAHEKRGALLAYVCLVVWPFLGLVWVLQAGRELHPPAAVNGSWKLSGDFSRLAGTPCSGLAQDATIEIVQSGRYLMLHFSDAGRSAASGRLEGDRMTATGAEGCVLTATVLGGGEMRRLEGTLAGARCAACEPVAFHASRADAPGRRTSH